MARARKGRGLLSLIRRDTFAELSLQSFLFDPTGSTPMSEQVATREPLGRRFAAHLTATGMANLGDGIVQTGVPLYALTLTRSPSQIALLTAAVWLPWLVCGLAAGVVVDRRD